MIRTPLLVVVGLLAIMSASCVSLGHALFDTDNVHEPPWRSPDVVFWWEETVDAAPLDFLAVFAEAADIHRRAGTSATYETAGVQVEMGATSKSTYRSWYRLPCPPPEYAADQMKKRLKGYSHPGKPDPRWRITAATDCRGCTMERAMAIWEEASARVAAHFPTAAAR